MVVTHNNIQKLVWIIRKFESFYPHILCLFTYLSYFMQFLSYSSQYLNMVKKKYNKEIAKEKIRSISIIVRIIIAFLMGLLIVWVIGYLIIGLYAATLG